MDFLKKIEPKRRKAFQFQWGQLNIDIKESGDVQKENEESAKVVGHEKNKGRGQRS